MADAAVVAHSGKSFGGGLPELRTVLAREGSLIHDQVSSRDEQIARAEAVTTARSA